MERKENPEGSTTQENTKGSTTQENTKGSTSQENTKGSTSQENTEGSTIKENTEGSATQEKPQGSRTMQQPQGGSTKQTHEGTPTDRFADGSFWRCLQYCRYFIEHAFDHTKDYVDQKVKNLIIIDLMLGGRLGPSITELIWHMMKYCNDGPFSPVWTHFLKSEYDDRPRSAQDEETESISNQDDNVLADRVGSASAGVKVVSKVLLKHQGVALYRTDVDSLNEPAFISDVIIRFCVAHYSSTLNCNDIRFLDASVSIAISIYPEFGKQYDLGSLPLELLTVSDNLHPERGYGANHWSLLILDSATNPLRPRLVHHDSSGNANRCHAERYAKAIRELLPDKFGDAILHEGPTPKHTNGYDCGVYVAAVTKAVLDWYTRPRQQRGTDWFSEVQEQVSVQSVSRLRADLQGLIEQLIEENENKAGESGKETKSMSNQDDSVLADQVASASAGVKDVHKLLLNYQGVFIYRADVDSLNSEDFVTDMIIQFCVTHHSYTINCKDFLFLDASGSIGISVDPAFGKQYDLGSFPLELLPVSDNLHFDKGDGGNHWSLLILDSVTNPFCPRFVHHDSSGNANRRHAERYAEAIRRLLPGRYGAAILHEGPTPKQTNGYDCGLYVAAVAKAVLDWYTRPREQRETDWFMEVQEQVSVQSVSRLRTDLRGLIEQLIEENENSNVD